MSGPSSPSALAYDGIAPALPTITSNCVNTPTASTATTSCVVTSNAGDTIVLFIQPQGVTISSVTDSAGATSVEIGVGPVGISAWYFANVAAGSHTITLNLAAAAGYPVLQMVSISGAALTSPIDGFTSGSGTTTSWDSGSLTTVGPSEMLIGFVLGGSDTYTLTAPVFTALPEGGWTGVFQGYLAAPTAGTYAFTGTMTNGATSLLLAVKP